MKNFTYLFPASILLVIADILSLFLFFGGYVSNLVPLYLILASAIIIIISGVRTVTIYSVGTNIGKNVFFITLGGFIAFFGELHNLLTLSSGMGVKPFGLDDFFFIPALISLGVGFYYAIKGNKLTWTAGKKSFLAVWSVILFVILIIVYTIAVGKSLSTVGVSIGYLVFSSLLSIAALRVFMATWEYRGGSLFQAWFGIFIGICLLIATIFALFMTIEASAVNHNLSYIPLGLLAASEVCLAFGFAVLGTISKTFQDRILINAK